MLIALHKNARTTPAVRAEIAASDETASVLAQRLGITEQTVYKWKKRSVLGDRSHTAHHLQTVLTPAQETVVVHLRRTLLLPLKQDARRWRRAKGLAIRTSSRKWWTRWAGACTCVGTKVRQPR
ncbi:MAG: hypothetical protein ACK40S_13065, partial [Burkholderiaceae bacterium]